LTEQVPLASRVQVTLSNEPALLLEKVTLPVGVMVAPPPVSVTVTVHMDATPTWPGEGEQVTVVVELC